MGPAQEGMVGWRRALALAAPAGLGWRSGAASFGPRKPAPHGRPAAPPWHHEGSRHEAAMSSEDAPAKGHGFLLPYRKAVRATLSEQEQHVLSKFEEQFEPGLLESVWQDRNTRAVYRYGARYARPVPDEDNTVYRQFSTLRQEARRRLSERLAQGEWTADGAADLGSRRREPIHRSEWLFGVQGELQDSVQLETGWWYSVAILIPAKRPQPLAQPQRKSGLDYRVEDRPLTQEMHRMIDEGLVPSLTKAAQHVVDKARGVGSESSKEKRLIRHYHADLAENWGFLGTTDTNNQD